MSKLLKKHQEMANRLEELQHRRDQLWTQGEIAKSELADFRKKSATDLISGADGESIATELAKREAKTGMFAGALAEIDAQIAEAQTVADEAQQKWNAEQDAETVREVRSTTVKIIKQMGALQVELAKVERLQGTCPGQIADFATAAGKLEESQAILESDAKVRERSKVPNAARRGGWLDDKHTMATLGSAIRDWAREQAR